MEQAFGARYREAVRLRDGRPGYLTLLRPEHAAAVARGFERLSTQARYQRFFTTKKHLSPRELEYLTRVDGQRHFALAAAVRTPRGWDGAAVARFVGLGDDLATAEPALTILDDYQGLGLGSTLMDRLVDAALERGYERFRAEVLHENEGMLAILRRLAGSEPLAIGHGVVEVHVDLAAAVLARGHRRAA